MNSASLSRRLAAAALALTAPHLHAQEPASGTLKVGLAEIRFNGESGDLQGPPGTTPPGVQAALVDTRTLALTYTYPLGGRWSLLAQAGTPPTVKFNGAGSAAALGQVGSARAWFPALLLQADLAKLGPVSTYGAFGVNHTFYTQRRVTDAYTAAFAGTASRADLKSSWGAVVKLGAELPLAPGWVADLAWSRYAIRTTATITTATPGLGDVARSVDVKADPDVFSLMLGRRF